MKRILFAVSLVLLLASAMTSCESIFPNLNQNAEDGNTPIIEISDDGYWIINGVKTEHKATGENGADGKDGVDGKTPTIEISDDGYWVINGTKTDYKAICADCQNNTDNKDNNTDDSSCDNNGNDEETPNNPDEPAVPEEPTADGIINIEELRGKIVVINFWGTWCGPCKAELPHFDKVAAEYADEVIIIAVHSVNSNNDAPAYIEANYNDSKIIFAYDVLLNANKPSAGDRYFKLLGGTAYYPRTLVLNKDGIITYASDGAISKEQLVNAINSAKEYETPTDATKGSNIENLCHSMDLEILVTE